MSFSDQERVDIRRFCGYPVFGGTPSSFQSYRFFQSYGFLEYRMSNLTPNEETTARSYMSRCKQLHEALFSASDNLDTASAAAWVHNPDEVSNRAGLYRIARMELCDYFGVPPGPNFGKGGNTVRVIV